MQLNTNISTLVLTVFSSFMLLLTSCSKDPVLESGPFVVAFKNPSANLGSITNQNSIDLVYSEIAEETGTFTVEIEENNAVYGVDYETIPVAESGFISMSIKKGQAKDSIVFKKLNPNLAGLETFIKYTIIAIDYPNANIQGTSSFVMNSSVSLGGNIEPELGGPNEENQVFVDLSKKETHAVQRDTWDLGFYCGEDFRVTLNGSIFMATKATSFTDIDLLTEADVLSMQAEVAVSTGNPINIDYVDAPNGNILETAIAAISNVDEENKVYLLNMGYEVGTATPVTGSVALAGDHRGWKKIRILKNGDDYLLQYANLNDTTHSEVNLSKDQAFNFVHFSFNTNTTVSVEPEKDQWDLCFTPFTNIILDPLYGSYIYSDFVVHNRKAAVKSYRVNTSEFAYEDFLLTNVDENSFIEDQTAIGDTWRNVFDKIVYSDRFYIIKDSEGNKYKLQFLALTNDDGVRGYPEFKYKLLQ